MLRQFTLIIIFAIATAFAASKVFKGKANIQSVDGNQSLTIKRISAIGCSPDWALIEKLETENEIYLLPGTGDYNWPITTSSDSAQLYFNQGIIMYYSFHIIEAMASFKKAIHFDKNCAILYWAQALTYGPNINDMGYIASPAALQAVKLATQYSNKANRVEKALINAMSVRYTADSADATRPLLNAAYTGEMKKVYSQFSDNADVQALYADAMMLEHPWDLWTIEGTPKAWTPLIEAVLEKLLLNYPNHPGANHYYIHVMEPSPFASRALPSANRLGKLTPGLSHTVHMPSHIYLRSGEYNTGTLVNENAVDAYIKTKELYAPASGGDFLYLIHNLHMQTNLAMLAGRSAYSIKTANETAKSVPKDYLLAPPPFAAATQYIFMIPTLVHIRFGNWEQLLQAPQPDQSLIYANILYHFGRGMAFSKQAKINEANTELLHMQQLMKDSSLLIPFAVFSPAIEGAGVAESLLLGSIALAEKKYALAIEAFTNAVNREERMVYTEPRDWLLNPKHYLGNAFLQSGDYMAAEKVLRKDLLTNQDNGWALYGIYQSLIAQKKKNAAADMLVKYQKAFKSADIKINAPVF